MKRKKKKARVVAVRKAGKEHAVVTIEGGERGYRRSPCEECPWRRDQTGKFPAEAFRISAKTAYDMAPSTFACHVSGKVKPQTCAGFLLKNSANNMGARIAAMKGDIDYREISDGGLELFNSYREMAEENGVAPDDPALARCRGDNDD